ncbi:hypothetical protein BGX38DRAFT_923387 [Terfezia claveryi]|nr:hypothetical protein BGX38DRAFT_923387 [Terfezia claveryi]
MSKPKGCKIFTHVQYYYNRCRGRVSSAGHAKDCPFQDSDQGDQDEAEDSDVEDDENEWNPVRTVKHTTTTAGISSIGPKAQNTPAQATTKSHNPWVHKTSKASPNTTPNTTGSMGNPSRPDTSTPSAPRKFWARKPMPPTHVTIRPPRK